MKSILLEREE